jgi:iron(II)-dependent oxidoreductase
MGMRQLIETMREFRARTLNLIGDLDDRQMIGPRLAIVNPPLWEIGHVAWTQEFWLLRHLRKEKPLIENGDRLYNSTDVAHDTRWELLLPSRESTLRYMNEVRLNSPQTNSISIGSRFSTKECTPKRSPTRDRRWDTVGQNP